MVKLVLRIPGQKPGDTFFKHSSDLGEGIIKRNPDIIQGVMYANGITSETDDDDVDTTFTDVDDMTDTFIIHKEGKALIIFNADFVPEEDTQDFGGLCRIMVDGVVATATTRESTIAAYVSHTGTQKVLYGGGGTPGRMNINTAAIVDLTEGEHTIKIQAKGLTGNANTIGFRRMDLMVWAAPVQV